MDSVSERDKATCCTVGNKKVHKHESLGATEKEKKQEEIQTNYNTVPSYFSVKNKGLQVQYYSQSVSPLVCFLFLSFPQSLVDY